MQHRYDFDKDGLLHQEDIRMLLLYVPFKREDALTQMENHSPGLKQGAEGLYDRSQSDYFTRKNDEGEINKFT